MKHYNLASKNGNRVVSKIWDDICVCLVPKPRIFVENESMLTIIFFRKWVVTKTTSHTYFESLLTSPVPTSFFRRGLNIPEFYGRRGGCKPTKDCYVSGTIGLAYVGTVCQMEKLLGFSILRVLTDCCVVNLQKGRHQSEVTKTIQNKRFLSGQVLSSDQCCPIYCSCLQEVSTSTRKTRRCSQKSCQQWKWSNQAHLFHMICISALKRTHDSISPFSREELLATKAAAWQINVAFWGEIGDGPLGSGNMLRESN